MLAALMRKEMLALRRDPHALGALFVMPAVFIVVMSLALANLHAPPLEDLRYAFDSGEQSGAAKRLMRDWERSHGSALPLPIDKHEALRRGDLAYIIELVPGVGKAIAAPLTPDQAVVRLIADPGLSRDIVRALQGDLAGVVGELRADALIARSSGMMPLGGQSVWSFIAVEQPGVDGKRPSSVQHNVPAWLVFGMFFVVIAIAGLFVQERQHGTLARLTSIGVPHRTQITAKALPYVGVNLLQAIAMLMVGVVVIPMFGGTALSLAGIDWIALFLVLLSISIASIGLALMIACLVRSHAQANAVGPLTNIVMAALGGIMIPTFVMPPTMQLISAFSPMNWGLEALHVVLLRQGGIIEAIPWLWRLVLFGVVALVTASLLFARRISP